MKKINITIVGAGYVGFSLSILFLKQGYKVNIFDTSDDVIDKIKNGISPINSPEFRNEFNSGIKIEATTVPEEAFINSDAIIIATPTNFSESDGKFDTSSISQTLNLINKFNPSCPVLIKSTIPVGFTTKLQESFSSIAISFSPEFLREDTAITDNLSPDRIIVSPKTDNSKFFIKLLKSICADNSVPTLIMNSNEAESVKLFSNAFLAMRVAYFNELDSFALKNNLNTKDIISGVSHDKRIGNFYNNPSFGYGGYCLPKDTKQLLNEFNNIDQKIITAIVESNDVRKIALANEINERGFNLIGIYRLSMKSGSLNSRSSAILDIIKIIQMKSDPHFLIYEPEIEIASSANILSGKKIKIVNNLDHFIKNSQLIIANRIHEELLPVKDKVFTRDIFGNN